MLECHQYMRSFVSIMHCMGLYFYKMPRHISKGKKFDTNASPTLALIMISYKFTE